MGIQYDIASKVLIEKCRYELLRHFMGLDVEQSILLEELPQETVSLRRSDFPVRVTDTEGQVFLVLLEIQTAWEPDVPMRSLEYRMRYRIKYDLPVQTCILLLTPSESAAERYEDDEVRFTYRLIPIYQWDARNIVADKLLCLMPFVPLMRHGHEVFLDAENLLYNSSMSPSDKGDMLTTMAILSGLISKDLAAELIRRRRDMMIESAAYDLIKQEGKLEGIQEGKLEGKLEGIVESVKKLLTKGMTAENVADLLDMDLIRVIEIEKSINPVQ